MRALRRLCLVGATAQIRTAKFEDREHLVVPSVMLVEGVVWAGNSDAPELVLASEFYKTYLGWNGRPVVPDHPNINGQFVSANSPLVLEKSRFGQLFNTDVKDERLLTEAWLDITRAEALGHDPKRVIERAKNGEPIEVSVGALMSPEETAGEHRGQRYARIWRDIVGDHFAMLPEGVKGACSVEMGCGAPRAASRYFVAAHGLRVAQESSMSQPAVAPPTPATQADPAPQRTVRERVLALIGFRNAKNSKEDLSDVELRRALEKALRANEPGFLGVDSVFPADNLVVYAAMPEDRLLLIQRTFRFKEDKTVVLRDDKQEVEAVTRYEPVRAASDNNPGQPCGCHTTGATAMDKAQRIAALVTSGKFHETDRKWLENVPEDRLSVLEAQQPPAQPAASGQQPPAQQPPAQQPPAQSGQQPPAQQPPAISPQQPQTPPSTGQTPAEQVQQRAAQTAEQYIEAAPAELRDTLREGFRASQAKKAGIIAGLKATGRCGYDDAKLNGMSLGELEQLAVLAAVPPPVVSFEGLGTPRPPQSTQRFATAAPDLFASVRTAREKSGN